MAFALVLVGCGSNSGSSKSARKSKKPTSGSAERASKERPRPGDQKVTLTWKGKQRGYTVHAPPGYTTGKQLPLVIAMHPYPSYGDYVAQLSGFSRKADEKGFLVAYPDGLDGGYNALACCGTEDDVGFIRTMTKRLIDTWKADPDRIYATGISNGGDMSYKLAVETDVLAAIAPVSGGYIGSATQSPDYVPRTPVSVMTFIGGQDQNYGAFDNGVKQWQQRLGCTAGPEKKVRGDSTRTTAKCRDTSEFVAYRLPSMGHSWPGSGDSRMGDMLTGIQATDLIWDFFASHPKRS
ncbi:alpha/beta hydrolase family esterase [Streptomyces sannanensis]|uniref:alpha/beta hydrolase family esterase n=1 Tax=Streptomyces sannanensis TaxID=285536 RepID=UPI0031ED4E4D